VSRLGSALSARDRRTLIVGATAIGSLVLVSRGLPAWRTWVREARVAAVEQLGDATRAEGVVRAFPAMRDSLAARNARYLALAPTLVSGGSVNAASATLASLVSTAAAESGVALGAVQMRTKDVPRRDSEAAHAVFTRVRVESDVTGDIRGIARFLATLEGGPVRLVVRDLTITQADAVGAPDRPEVLRAMVAVEGLALSRPR
jgi:Type II secretion system (T2SS), protein M subtype b